MSKPTSKGSRGGAVQRVQDYIDKGAFEAELARRVAIRTESQKFPDPAALAECRRYLDSEMMPAFAAMGFTSKVYDNPIEGQGPVLLATRIEDPELPTVLGYGHGDVVRGMEDQWTKGEGPWVTARDGDRLYGRGTADNKGQHTINMAALRAVMAERGGRLGFNAKFMIEMGEEAGSKGLKDAGAAAQGRFRRRHPHRLRRPARETRTGRRSAWAAAAPSTSTWRWTCARAATTPATGAACSPIPASSWRTRSPPSSGRRASC